MNHHVMMFLLKIEQLGQMHVMQRVLVAMHSQGLEMPYMTTHPDKYMVNECQTPNTDISFEY